ncbi:MAG TPA: MFS transporter, partial [Thermodesulfobacteriota bacterium]|nr:MFS transporter [Thermodesulfobacteriota bacterium]
LSDRLGRGRVMLVLAATSMACSFLFGWSIGWPLALVMGIGMIYAFSALGDSPIFSAALTEVVDTAYLGSAFGLRSLMGFGAGAVAPLAFGAVLDWSNALPAGQRLYANWGWAFGILGLGGLGAVWATRQFGKVHK